MTDKPKLDSLTGPLAHVPSDPSPAPVTDLTDPHTAVTEAVRGLDEALTVLGITLPSLGIDPPSYAFITPRPLVELGRCNLETARRLTVALRNAAP
ncbi:hypothetical protein [Streptomyces sp. NPDC059142]|uniref:hypothetical protein n=1 Tax=Streptomyces sp. NPDC059142 TaxID=3346739 RepID=UPI0036B807BC